MKQLVCVLSLAALCSFAVPQSGSSPKAPAQKTVTQDYIIEYQEGPGCDGYGSVTDPNGGKGSVCYFTIPNACKMRIILAEYVQSECGWMNDDVKQKIADHVNGR